LEPKYITAAFGIQWLRLKFLDFPIFLDLTFKVPHRQTVSSGEKLQETENRPRGTTRAWQLPKPDGRGLFLSRSFWNSLSAANKKGDSTQEGQHLCLVQERKAENEECL
jgi:hypothetical protein